MSGRALVVFDGLDELLDTGFRQQITEDVESFANLYPQVRILVTSRKVGYERAPLEEAVFSTFLLSEFTDAQVETYAKKWFALDKELSRDQQGSMVGSFLRESEDIKDLRSNALMLGLLCNIYQGENYIPRNRPDVYEKCSTMLFRRWDSSRGIKADLPFEAHVDPAIKHLAFWIYSTESLECGVTERNLVQRTTEYLLERRYEDPIEAQAAAEAFISFCRGRAWVFTDTGTTRAGERLYQFTHGTFLEYFAASHLVRVSAKPMDLWVRLRDRIVRQEWDLVAQMAVQIQNRNLEGAADDFLSILLDSLESEGNNERRNALLFAVRCLSTIVPGPKATRAVSKRTVDVLCSPPQGSGVDYMTLARELPSVATENLGTVADVIVEECLSLADPTNNSDTRTRASDLGFNIDRWEHHDSTGLGGLVGPRFASGWINVVNSPLELGLDAALGAFRYGVLSFRELTGRYEMEALFHSIGSDILGIHGPPVIYRVLGRIGWYESKEVEVRVDIDALVREIAGMFREMTPPYVRFKNADYFSYWVPSGIPLLEDKDRVSNGVGKGLNENEAFCSSGIPSNRCGGDSAG